MPSKPTGLGGWASVAGHNDEIQRVATADRKDIDRYAAGGGVSALNRRTSSADGQRLMQWYVAFSSRLQRCGNCIFFVWGG